MIARVSCYKDEAEAEAKAEDEVIVIKVLLYFGLLITGIT